MADVFGAKSGVTRVKAGKATVKIGADTCIATGVNITFQRNVEMVPTLGKDRVMSIGEPAGQFTAQTIYMGNKTFSKISENGCIGFSASVVSGDECNGNGKAITMNDCVISAVSWEAQGGRGYIGHGVTIVFANMTV